MDLKEKCHFGRIDIPNLFMDLKKKKCQFFGRIDRIFFLSSIATFFFREPGKKICRKKTRFSSPRALDHEMWQKPRDSAQECTRLAHLL
jgi:hypothetical protein